jgi:hypothetical protein
VTTNSFFTCCVGPATLWLRAPGSRRKSARAKIEEACQHDLATRRESAGLVGVKRAAGHGEHSPEGEMVWRVKILVTNNTGRRLRDLVVSLIPPQQRTDLRPLGQRPPEVLDSDRWSLDLIGPSDEHGGMPPFETAVEFELDG